LASGVSKGEFDMKSRDAFRSTAFSDMETGLREDQMIISGADLTPDERRASITALQTEQTK
jgi:hypothetical protein